MYHADASKLSFVILLVFVGVTCYIGSLTYRLWKQLKVSKQQIETCWFIADNLPTVGMIGTVIGFLMMLGTAFEELDVTQVASVQDAITIMALGMSTALVTTLVGLISSLLVKLQLQNISTDDETPPA